MCTKFGWNRLSILGGDAEINVLAHNSHVNLLNTPWGFRGGKFNQNNEIISHCHPDLNCVPNFKSPPHRKVVENSIARFVRTERQTDRDKSKLSKRW